MHLNMDGFTHTHRHIKISVHSISHCSMSLSLSLFLLGLRKLASMLSKLSPTNKYITLHSCHISRMGRIGFLTCHRKSTGVNKRNDAFRFRVLVLFMPSPLTGTPEKKLSLTLLVAPVLFML